MIFITFQTNEISLKKELTLRNNTFKSYFFYLNFIYKWTSMSFRNPVFSDFLYAFISRLRFLFSPKINLSIKVEIILNLILLFCISQEFKDTYERRNEKKWIKVWNFCEKYFLRKNSICYKLWFSLFFSNQGNVPWRF